MPFEVVFYIAEKFFYSKGTKIKCSMVSGTWCMEQLSDGSLSNAIKIVEQVIYIVNQPPNAVIEIIFDEKLPGRCSC